MAAVDVAVAAAVAAVAAVDVVVAAAVVVVAAADVVVPVVFEGAVAL